MENGDDMSDATRGRESVQRSPEPRRTRNLFAAILFLLAALWGVEQAIAPYNGALYLVFALLMASAASGWMAFDAQLRSYSTPRVVYLIVFLTWPIALPPYFIYALGWRGVAWSALCAVGLLFAVFACFYVTFLTAWMLGYSFAQ